mmetsp:Transcript_108330/g.209722  ORF Transcript_108330/g.209722 Transcript_108330/m.209722 type:complete len:395 (+) Transcript_108330:135-1319(+)
MPSVREIAMTRAKEPAKVHAMERVPVGTNVASPAGSVTSEFGVGGPSPIVNSAGGAGVPAAASRPPRARPSPTRCSSSSSRGAPCRASEARRPGAQRQSNVRPGSEPRAAARGSCKTEEGGHGTVGDDASQKAGPQQAGPQRGRRPRASSVSAAAQPRPRMSDPAPAVDRKDVGQVPAYLKRRNEEQAAAKLRAERPPSPQAPPGFRRVGEDELRSTREILGQRKVEVEKAQRALPFKIETMGQKQREKDLASRLAHIDKLLGMFAQPSVFIPSDSPPIAVSVPPLAPGPSDAGGGRSAPTTQQDAAMSAVRGRDGSGMREAMHRPSSREALSRAPSREGRAAKQAERMRQNCAIAPWEHEELAGPAVPRGPVRTDVKVAAPPGGRSSLSLHWD